MTLSRALGHIDHETPPEDQYRVKLFDRLRDLGFDDTYELGPDAMFEYSWSGGYERTYSKESPRTGSATFGGSYHPNDDMCEGDGLCKWCGTVLWDDMP